MSDLPTKGDLLRYVRLETDENTADLLMKSSFLKVGVVINNGSNVHYWSYPTACGVAWVEYNSAENYLGTVCDDDVPVDIVAATASREEHPAKTPRKPAPAADRSPIPEPRWIPAKHMPMCHFFPVWQEAYSFPEAVRRFAATPVKENLGPIVLYFGIKLTSGRYAMIEANEDQQQEITIELELEEDVDSRSDESCIGFVRIVDIKEILTVLGVEYIPPKYKYPYQWR